jgi:hypothetical protein
MCTSKAESGAELLVSVPDAGRAHRLDISASEGDTVAFPVLTEPVVELLRSAGEVLHPAVGEVLWTQETPMTSIWS